MQENNTCKKHEINNGYNMYTKTHTLEYVKTVVNVDVRYENGHCWWTITPYFSTAQLHTSH